MCLHDAVSRAATTLWDSPVDVFVWHLDGAGFAVEAVLCVDDQLPVIVILVHLPIQQRGTTQKTCTQSVSCSAARPMGRCPDLVVAGGQRPVASAVPAAEAIA